MLPLLQAFVTGARQFEISALPVPVIEHALGRALGPVLAYVADRTGDLDDVPLADRIRAADLTAKALTGAKYQALSEVLAAARDLECGVVLLKGAATALRYYPAPHLRAMGDLDLLVPAECHGALETRLRGLGFQQRAAQPAAAFVGRHHSMPFFHPHRDVRIELHTGLHPRQYPLAREARFSWDAVASQLSPVAVGDQTAYAMNHEEQLVYTSARWAERLDPQHGLFPLLDAVLLIGKQSETLDWNRILTAVRGSWAASALHLMLTYVDRWRLAQVPPGVLGALRAMDCHLNGTSIHMLHSLITRYPVEGRSFGILPEHHVQLVWSTLLQPASPSANLLALPYYLAFPPRSTGRFSPLVALRRLRSFSRRVLSSGAMDASSQ